MPAPAWIAAVSPPWRSMLVGAVTLGTLGCAAGLVIGLRVHAPTAWAATFEIGIPAAFAGAVVGLVAGSLRVLVLRQPGSSYVGRARRAGRRPRRR